MPRILLLAACILAVAAEAQNQSPAANAINIPPGVVELSNGWHTHAGDDLGFAQTTFDDSAWPFVSIGPNSAVPGGRRWFRLKLTLPADSPPLSVLVMAPGGAYEAYVNGQRIPGPRIQSWLTATEDRPQIIPLPHRTEHVELALRFRLPEQMGEIYSPSLNAFLGSAAAIRDQASAVSNGNLLQFLPSAAITLAIVVAGLGMLGLFLTQRSSPEYLWLGIYLALMGSSEGLWTSLPTALLPTSVNSLYADPAIYLQTIAQIEFTYAFIRRKVGRGWRWYQLILLALAVTSVLSRFFIDIMRWITVAAYTVLQASIILPAALGLPLILLFWFRKGNREAGWLILPSLMPAAGIAAANIGFTAALFGWRSLAFLVDPLRLGPLWFQPSDLADAVFLLAIGAVIFLRFARVSREQARSAAELEAAQKVQALLVPSAVDCTPGWKIETVYCPAGEVGGDFYHVQPLHADSALVVVGDVSGKGVGAALRVAAIVGALRETTAETPASVLKRLNCILWALSEGGFTTCICARVSLNGSATLANAGHLAPYRNGGEMELEAGLPLGLVADLEYIESHFQVAPGDTLTFLSDGVIEARTPSGELFGFERARQISGQSAKQIAEAAQAFGQEDDITVLTLERIVTA